MEKDSARLVFWVWLIFVFWRFMSGEPLLYAQQSCDTLLAIKLQNEGKNFHKKEDIIALSNKIIQATKDCNSPYWKHTYHFTKGSYYWHTENWDSSLWYLNKAIVYFKHLNNYTTQMNCYNRLGQLYARQGDFVSSIQNFKQMYQAAVKDKNLIQQINALQNLGVSYSYIGEYRAALPYFYKGLSLLQSTPDTIVLSTLHLNTGATLQYIKQNPEALRHANKALYYATLKRDSLKMASIYNLLGTIYVEQKQANKALSYFLKADSLFIKYKQTYYHAQVLTNIGSLYQTQNDTPNAGKYHTQALELSEANGLKEIVCRNLIDISVMYSYLNIAKRQQYARRALLLAKELGSLELLEVAYKNMAHRCNEENKPIEAYRYLRQGEAYQDSMFNENLLIDMGRLETVYQLEQAEAQAEAEVQAAQKRKQQAQTQRNYQLYMWISGGFALFFMVFWGLGRKRLSPNQRAGLLFVSLLLFFEFIRLPLEPWRDQITHGYAIFNLSINILLNLFILAIERLFNYNYNYNYNYTKNTI